MFTGERRWSNGVEAGRAYKKYFGTAKIPITKTMKNLLRYCFYIKEAKRPHDFKEIEIILLQIYHDSTGKAYARPEAKAAAHAESLYNQSVHLWRNGRIDDMEALHIINSNYSEMTDCYLAKIHLSRGDARSALACLRNAENTSGETDDIRKMVAAAHKMIESDKEGRCIRTFEGHTDGINSVCFSPDGKTVLSGSNDRTIKLWDVAAGQCIHTFEEHTNEVRSVCFSPFSTGIISGSYNEFIIYDLDYELSFPGWTNWDEGARPYLDIFLAIHPHWTNEDFDNILIPELQRRGYGWLRPAGVKAILKKMSAGSTKKCSFWKRLTGRK
jgi:hypothetical protein